MDQKHKEGSGVSYAHAGHEGSKFLEMRLSIFGLKGSCNVGDHSISQLRVVTSGYH